MMNQRPLSSLTKVEIRQRLNHKKNLKANSPQDKEKTLAGLIQLFIYLVIGLVVFGFGGLAAL